jgi:hypothetical protein
MENKEIELILENIAAAHGDAFVADSIKDSFHKDVRHITSEPELAAGQRFAETY